jgi:hypothetical protein
VANPVASPAMTAGHRTGVCSSNASESYAWSSSTRSSEPTCPTLSRQACCPGMAVLRPGLARQTGSAAPTLSAVGASLPLQPGVDVGAPVAG